MNLTPWAWIIVPLGVCRAMMLVLHDKIFERPRGFIERHGGSYLRYLIGCPWCVSTQLGLYAAALLAWDYTRRVTLWVLLGLAISLVAVFVDRGIIDRFAPDPPAPPEPQVPEQVSRAFDS